LKSVRAKLFVALAVFLILAVGLRKHLVKPLKF
jgi:hypothetical protein